MIPLTNRLPKGGSKGNPCQSEDSLDSVYLEAAGRNDEKACHFMVERKAASTPGCLKDEDGTPLKLYHGTAFGFTRFDGGLDGINWATPDRGYADVYADPGRHPEPDNEGVVYELYGFPTKIADIGDINVPCDEESVARVAKAIGSDVGEVRKMSGDYPWDTWDMLYELNEYFAQIARKNGYDCLKAIEGGTGGDGWGFKRKVATYGFLDPKRLKSADPITYNEDGVVPLSKRFDFRSDDIREDVQGADIDAEYMDAAKRGDLGRCVDMVDREARRRGYSHRAYHGTPDGGFTKFDPVRSRDPGRMGTHSDSGMFFTTSSETARTYSGTSRKSQVYDVFLRCEHPLVVDADGAPWGDLSGCRVLGTDGLPTSFTVEKLFGYCNSYTSRLAEYVNLKTSFDSIVLKNVVDNGRFSRKSNAGTKSDVIIVFKPEQIKSAEPITYDNQGNIVPLSRRFDFGSDDIRESRNWQKVAGNSSQF